MIKWNEKREQMQKADLKTSVIKLASLETYTAKNGQDVVVIKGEQPSEKFTNFMGVWRR